MLMQLTVSGSMETVKAKKFVVFRSFLRVELYADCTFNNIPETFSSVGSGVEFSKLHI